MAKILIMDDEPGLCSVVRNILRPLGHPLFTAEDGRQAIEIARRENPDVAILDVRVPDMDGMEVLAELRKMNPAVKCIILSGFGDKELAAEAMRRGAFDYLSKPFKIDEVIKIVRRALGHAPDEAPPKIHEAPPAPAAAAPDVRVVQKPFPFLIIGAAAAGLAAVVVAIVLLKGPGVREIPVPYANPSGICRMDPHFWISDGMSGNIYRHGGSDTLPVVSVYKTDNVQPVGLAYDGEFLWSCNAVEKRVYKHTLDASLKVAAIYALKDVRPAGLYYDGVNLWVIDTEGGRLYRHKADDTLSVVNVYDSPAIAPVGMFREGDAYFIGDYKTGNVYEVSGENFSVGEVFILPGFEKGGRKLSGLAWDGTFLWVCAEGSSRVFKYRLKDLKKAKT